MPQWSSANRITLWFSLLSGMFLAIICLAAWLTRGEASVAFAGSLGWEHCESWEWMGFGVMEGHPYGGPIVIYWVSWPLLVVSAIALLLPARWAVLFCRHRRCQRRAALGLCIHCGYDLRASPTRCPECGHDRHVAEVCYDRSQPG
jgi:hypothetical protein